MRVTRVGAVKRANSAIASFSLWSRSARGSLNTRAPSRTASSRSQVAVTYSMSKGGSLRISTASNSVSASSRGRSMWYQRSLFPVSSRRQDSPTTRPRFHITPSCIRMCSAWPRPAASTIMA